MSLCTILVALVPAPAGIAVALLAVGILEAGVAVVRNLSLREALPPSALAAGYSVLYAAVGIGYTASALLAGAVQALATPSIAILAGVGLTLILVLIGTIGEKRVTHDGLPDGAPSEIAADGPVAFVDCGSDTMAR
jgi:MFS family permease